MHEIGRIKLLQVQQSGLKVKQHPYGYYDPTPLLVVESLLLYPDGVIGVTPDGRRVIDVHHMDHPASRNHKGVNGVSVGFTSHYEAMRSKFGDHLVDGCAGENILVEADDIITLADLGKQLAIQTQKTGELIYLTRLKVAAPCVEFSLFAASHGMALPAPQLKETLQFLDGGKRGFYATVSGHDSDEMLVQAGDRVFADDRE
jgi:hypothetical protein